MRVCEIVSVFFCEFSFRDNLVIRMCRLLGNCVRCKWVLRVVYWVLGVGLSDKVDQCVLRISK